MGLNLRLMHVNKNGVNHVWDVKLVDERTNARVHMNMDGSEWLDIIILGGQHKARRLKGPDQTTITRPVAPISRTQLSRTQRRKRRARKVKHA